MKVIRANLILESIQSNLGAEIVVVIRHPCGVVGSRIRNGWVPGLNDCVCPDSLIGWISEERQGFLATQPTLVQKHAFDWCIENRILMKMAEAHGWIVVSYEAIQNDPQHAFDLLIKHLGLEWSPRSRRRMSKRVSTPSSQDAGPSSVQWHYPLSESDGEQVLALCRDLGCQIYGRDRFPVGSVNGPGT